MTRETTTKDVLVICGPTATGKSDLAVDVALRLERDLGVPVEIISADSRQVYRGLDIGAGKIAKREMRGVPHHLLDVADPKASARKGASGRFTVGRYQELARAKIDEISARGALPILCGGTGFYIDATVLDIALPDMPPDPALRKKLSKLSADALYARLKKLDPQRARSIDRHNPVRLIRAIEIASSMGATPVHPTQPVQPDAGAGTRTARPLYRLLRIGTRMPDAELKERIRARLDARLKRGMLAEAKRLRACGLSFARMEELGLEYRYQALYLQKKLSRGEMRDILATRIWQYARRQKTWFRRDSGIRWMDPRKPRERATMVRLIERWLQKSARA